MAGWEDLDQALPLDIRDVAQAREEAKKVLEKDPGIQLTENASLREVMKDVLRSRPDWGKIA